MQTVEGQLLKCLHIWMGIEWFNRNKVLGYEKDTEFLQQAG